MLQNELNRLGVEMTHQEVATLFGRAEVDDFLEDLGCGELTTVDVAKKVLELGKVEEPLKEVSEELKPQEAPQMPAIAIDGVAVQGIGNMLSYLARCCNPMPPDEILGFVTRGRGVAIHRRDCPNVSRLDPDRIILVSWGVRSKRTSRVKIRIQAYDRAGLLNEITAIFKEENINLLDASAVTARKDNMALITATIEVRDVEQLSRVLTQHRAPAQCAGGAPAEGVNVGVIERMRAPDAMRARSAKGRKGIIPRGLLYLRRIVEALSKFQPLARSTGWAEPSPWSRRGPPWPRCAGRSATCCTPRTSWSGACRRPARGPDPFRPP